MTARLPILATETLGDTEPAIDGGRTALYGTVCDECLRPTSVGDQVTDLIFNTESLVEIRAEDDEPPRIGHVISPEDNQSLVCIRTEFITAARAAGLNVKSRPIIFNGDQLIGYEQLVPNLVVDSFWAPEVLEQAIQDSGKPVKNCPTCGRPIVHSYASFLLGDPVFEHTPETPFVISETTFNSGSEWDIPYSLSQDFLRIYKETAPDVEYFLPEGAEDW